MAKTNPWGTGPKPPGWGTYAPDGTPQFGTGTRGAARYQNDPVFRSQADQALAWSRNRFAGGGGQTTGQGGGGNPYAGILNEFLNSSKSRFAADSAADAASRDAALRRFIISYGDTPDFNQLGISEQTRGFLEKALNQQTRDLAMKNNQEGTSVAARQKAAQEKANRQIVAQRAARGMLRSGGLGSDMRDQAQAYKNQVFDTLNEMLGGMEGTVGNFLQAERARADALAQAMLQAQMAAAQEYGGDVSGAGPTTGGVRTAATRFLTPAMIAQLGLGPRTTVAQTSIAKKYRGNQNPWRGN